MSESLWNELEEFWNNGGNIEEKAEKYHYLYEHPESKEKFSWGHHKDEQLEKKSSKSGKVLRWGIPNHVLGDIDKAKVVIGLLNPRTQTEESKNCDTVGEYIRKERTNESNEDVSNEFYVGDTNNGEQLHEFYQNHILSKENVLYKEIKALRKMYEESNESADIFVDKHKEDDIKIVAYYFTKYYSKVFSEGKDSLFKNALKHYTSIFDKMDETKKYTNNKDIEEKFEQALDKIKVANIELIPYRSFKSGSLSNLDNLESSKLSAKILIEKIKKDKDVIIILRSADKWEELFEEYCINEEINYKQDIVSSIYKFKNQSAALSERNIVSALNEDTKGINKIIDKIRDVISLKDFEKYLDDIISKNS
ncbi:hypothetical protein [Staphylococcus argensis]|uniref:Uncharacterized protein n=1 Tax=Staphylococcus argensis TaxID=1607738 RepID=A0A2K4FAX6_9STAP|nr:hypothetical protein [Staphylococcus argensis]MCY6991705.1 hypothetical protein [Staphylococcus argensis]POA08508.1 hypothetical protein CD039_10570 [Staphylococcus argensis]